jgi:hypothetical protein
MEGSRAELENLLASSKALAVALVAVPAKKRRLSIGATKYLRRDKERFTFVWHLEKRPQEINLED